MTSGRLQRLRRSQDFQRCYTQGRMVKNQLGVLHVVPNSEGASRVGYSVSKKLGKAVVRNRVKRRLRSVVDSLDVRQGYDIVLSARVRARDESFAELERGVRDLFRRAKLLAAGNGGRVQPSGETGDERPSPKG